MKLPLPSESKDARFPRSEPTASGDFTRPLPRSEPTASGEFHMTGV